METLRPYLPIAILLILTTVLAFTVIGISAVLGPKRGSKRKLMPYESGMTPIGGAMRRIPVRFYLVAMIFILFDIELIFLLPWAVVFNDFVTRHGLGLLIYVEMMTFVVLLLVGYVYVLKKGLFEWGSRARVEAEAEARALALKEAKERAVQAGAPRPARAA